MRLPDEFIKNEVKLREEFNLIQSSKSLKKENKGKFARCFHFYELCREIALHSNENNFQMVLESVFLPPGTPKEEEAGKALFGAACIQITDFDNDYVPWVTLSEEQKNLFVEIFNGPVESLNNGRRLDVYDITDSMVGANDSTWQEFRHMLKKKHGPVWLIAQFDPEDISNWSRQFETWRKKQAKCLGLTIGSSNSSKSENVGAWLDQLSRLRLLRAVDWKIAETDQIEGVARLKPDRRNLWTKNVRQVEAHCRRFFSCEISFQPSNQHK